MDVPEKEKQPREREIVRLPGLADWAVYGIRAELNPGEYGLEEREQEVYITLQARQQEILKEQDAKRKPGEPYETPEQWNERFIEEGISTQSTGSPAEKDALNQAAQEWLQRARRKRRLEEERLTWVKLENAIDSVAVVQQRQQEEEETTGEAHQIPGTELQPRIRRQWRIQQLQKMIATLSKALQTDAQKENEVRKEKETDEESGTSDEGPPTPRAASKASDDESGTSDEESGTSAEEEEQEEADEDKDDERIAREIEEREEREALQYDKEQEELTRKREEELALTKASEREKQEKREEALREKEAAEEQESQQRKLEKLTQILAGRKPRRKPIRENYRRMYGCILVGHERPYSLRSYAAQAGKADKLRILKDIMKRLNAKTLNVAKAETLVLAVLISDCGKWDVAGYKLLHLIDQARDEPILVTLLRRHRLRQCFGPDVMQDPSSAAVPSTSTSTSSTSSTSSTVLATPVVPLLTSPAAQLSGKLLRGGRDQLYETLDITNERKLAIKAAIVKLIEDFTANNKMYDEKHWIDQMSQFTSPNEKRYLVYTFIMDVLTLALDTIDYSWKRLCSILLRIGLKFEFVVDVLTIQEMQNLVPQAWDRTRGEDEILYYPIVNAYQRKSRLSHVQATVPAVLALAASLAPDMLHKCRLFPVTHSRALQQWLTDMDPEEAHTQMGRAMNSLAIAVFGGQYPMVEIARDAALYCLVVGIITDTASNMWEMYSQYGHQFVFTAKDLQMLLAVDASVPRDEEFEAEVRSAEGVRITRQLEIAQEELPENRQKWQERLEQVTAQERKKAEDEQTRMAKEGEERLQKSLAQMRRWQEGKQTAEDIADWKRRREEQDAEEKRMREEDERRKRREEQRRRLQEVMGPDDEEIPPVRPTKRQKKREETGENVQCHAHHAHAHYCAYCGKRATMQCSGCGSACYCCERHQTKDWPSHCRICPRND